MMGGGRGAKLPAHAQLPPTPEAPLGSLTMYTTTWCGYCRRLKTQLDSAGIAYTEIDIEENPETAAIVAEVNGGDWIVPTVVYPDGTTATNPSLADVKRALAVV
jgi:mycoredoxin